MKRILALLLCLVLTLALLASCGKSPAPADTDSVTTAEQHPTAPNDTEPETNESGKVVDGLPDVTYDKEISILSWSAFESQTFPKEYSATDVISAVAYTRTVNIERRFGVSLNLTFQPGHWDVLDDFIAQAEKAGDVGYDLICSYSLGQSPLALKGMLTNLHALDYPQLDAVWWSESVEAWTQYDTLFFACGTSSASNFASMDVIYYLRKAVADMELTDPAQLTVDKEWTLEKLKEYSLHWDGPNADDPDGLYGLGASHMSIMDAFYYGAGFKAVEEDESGKLIVASSQLHRTNVTNYVDDLIELFDRDGAIIAGAGVTEKDLLEGGKAVFMVQSLANLTRMSDTTYGVVPIPMWTESQGQYYTLNNNGYDVWSIPTSSQNAEMCGVILDAIIYSDYHDIAPVYYEQKIQYRYSSSALAYQVFDIIRNSQVFDFGRVTQKSTGGIAESPFRSCFWSSNGMVCQNVYSNILDANIQTYTQKLSTYLLVYKMQTNQ